MTGAAIVFTVSEAVGAQVREMAGRKTTVVTARNKLGPIEMERFASIARRRVEVSGRGAKVVLIMGSLVAAKGARDFLTRVAPAISADVRIVFVGPQPDPAYMAQCKRDAASLSNEVLFVGAVSDVRGYYAQASVLAIPSYAEGVPRVALEAQAAGVPVVATAFLGAEECMQDGVTGFVTENWRQFALRIDMLVEDEALSISMGEAGRRFVILREEAVSSLVLEDSWGRLLREFH